jgi:Tfp pilus assembly protein PilF
MKITKFVLISIAVLAGTTAKADDGLSSLLQQSSPPPAPAPENQPSSTSPATPSPGTASPQTSSIESDTSASDSLEKLNATIAQNPNDPIAYIRRGNIFGNQKMWGEAQADYEKALAIDPQIVVVRIDLAELRFRQKQYDQARPGFLALTHDPTFGDLASYKVFLCDLFAAHDEAASQELAAFNSAGKNPSYYFGNIAWDIVHHNFDDARGYLKSARYIYHPGVARLYATNLIELGYLPLHN